MYLRRTYIERFLPLILDIEEEGQQVNFSSQGINYLHIMHFNLYRELSFLHTLLD